MKIAVGADHGGYPLKPGIIAYLKKLGHEVIDFGTDSEESVDYPDYGKAVGEAVASAEADLGIVMCGTGVGISISCNKVKGIRCACVSEPYSARMARKHNNANILAFGGRVVGLDLAEMIVDEFLNAEFEAGRHERRIEKISDMEEN